jgi:hypothetical protein
MKHIKLFEAYIRDIQESKTDLSIVASEKFLTSGQFEYTLNLDRTDLSYSNGLVAQKIVEMTKRAKIWKIEFKIPKVANYELLPSGINITPIGNLRTNDLPKDSGTNFKNDIIGPTWWKKRTKGDINRILEILTGYCVKAVYTDYVNVNLEVKYNKNLERFGYTPVETLHNYDPSLHTGDLINWIESSPFIRDAQGSSTSLQKELMVPIDKILSILPMSIDIKVSWEI